MTRNKPRFREFDSLHASSSGQLSEKDTMSTATSNPNRNWLTGMACPKCGVFGPFSIFAFQAGMVRVRDDGTDFIEGNIEWEATSRCECLACCHTGMVGEFRGETPAFNQYQQAVIEVYDDGAFADLRPGEVRGCGDTLLKFLLLELSTREDCDSVETALDRLASAQRQLTDVLGTLDDRLG